MSLTPSRNTSRSIAPPPAPDRKMTGDDVSIMLSAKPATLKPFAKRVHRPSRGGKVPLRAAEVAAAWPLRTARQPPQTPADPPGSRQDCALLRMQADRHCVPISYSKND